MFIKTLIQMILFAFIQSVNADQSPIVMPKSAMHSATALKDYFLLNAEQFSHSVTKESCENGIRSEILKVIADATQNGELPEYELTPNHPNITQNQAIWFSISSGKEDVGYMLVIQFSVSITQDGNYEVVENIIRCGIPG